MPPELTPRRRAADRQPASRKGFWVGEKQIGTWAQAISVGAVLAAMGWAASVFFGLYKASDNVVIRQEDRLVLDTAVGKMTDAKFASYDAQLIDIRSRQAEREQRIERLESRASNCTK